MLASSMRGNGLSGRARQLHTLSPLHAIIGAKILADEGLPESIVKAVETHILLGLTQKEIEEKPWPLPARDYTPQTLEGKILCYADCFHSKRPVLNSFERFHDKLLNQYPDQAIKFKEWSKVFKVPDLEKLSKKYNHPIQ
jgi:uncharacterized protein